MALLCFNSFTLNPPSSSSIFPLPTTTPISRMNVALHPNCFKGIRISTPFVVKRRKNAIFIASAAADSNNGADGVTSPEEGEGKKENDAVVVPVDKLPLESKLKERAEQRLKMKLAKKIRLRRKRLVRKRKLRKKGKWPPSKMRKLKNV